MMQEGVLFLATEIGGQGDGGSGGITDREYRFGDPLALMNVLVHPVGHTGYAIESKPNSSLSVKG